MINASETHHNKQIKIGQKGVSLFKYLQMLLKSQINKHIKYDHSLLQTNMDSLRISMPAMRRASDAASIISKTPSRRRKTTPTRRKSSVPTGAKKGNFWAGMLMVNAAKRRFTRFKNIESSKK